jgi:hypothetical protein
MRSINKLLPLFEETMFSNCQRQRGKVGLHDVDISPGHSSEFSLLLADIRGADRKNWCCTH